MIFCLNIKLRILYAIKQGSMNTIKLILVSCSLIFLMNKIDAQNPIIRDQYTADPSARVFNGKVYVFPSHDIRAVEGKGRPGWFCMEDYHVFSSENLTDWTDHGVIVSQNKVPWADSTAYSMWAPDCIERNGKFYFYFPATTNTVGRFGRKGFSIGVAVADKPEGPYIPQNENIKDLFGIDPNVFIDNDGQAYLYWSMRNIYVAKLKENMLELETEPEIIQNLPEKGLKEGPWVFERNGIYYLTFPHVENETERLEYAIGDNPLGPFKMTGVIMDESPGCWTNHHSIIQYNGQWYLFYHQNDLSPDFDKNRSVRIDSLFFNDDGTIRKVKPTLRGVGITNATEKIQFDRYSQISETGVNVQLIDTLDTFRGWKTLLDSDGAWVQYNAVGFGNKKLKKAQVEVLSATGGILQIRLNNANGPVISEVKIPDCENRTTVESTLLKFKKGIHNLFITLKGDEQVEIDWVRFE
ncbi:MAG: family 43 glycosylhydrolase [Prolixibacteraceae bacterium]|nr:family 43 glycosylhydrolase [Prolixibacteraceae bacterium]